MENVYNIERSPIFEEVLVLFKSAGYGITKHVWDASYMGVPQMRRRYFVIGKLGEKDDFLLDGLLSGLSKERMTVRKYFEDKQLDAEYIYQHPRTSVSFKNDVLTNELPPQDYWQIKKVASDIDVI